MLRPVRMVKITLVGLKAERDRVVSVLHDLGVVQIEPVGRAALEVLGAERTSDDARTVGDLLVRFRALATALGPPARPEPQSFADRPAIVAAAQAVPIDEEVGLIQREIDQLTTERKTQSEAAALLERFDFFTEPLELLSGPNLQSFFGEGPVKAFAAFRGALPAASAHHLLAAPTDKSVRFVVSVRTGQAEALVRTAQGAGVRLQAAPLLTGTPPEARKAISSRLAAVDRRLAELRARLAELNAEWAARVFTIEEALAIESRKLEVVTRFGAGAQIFNLEAWVPQRSRDLVERRVAEATAGRVHVQEIPTTESPPTIMENPPGFRMYEFFIRFYSLPQADEWDPTLIFAIVFPIFFGLMLGDWGYGLTILLICLWMIAGFPGRQHLPGAIKNFVKRIMSPSGMRQLAYALIPGCLVAIGLGLVFNEFYGFQLLPYTALVDPVLQLSSLLLLSGYIGLGVVVLGFGLGGLKAYFHGHGREALGKLGGILFSLGLADYGLGVLHVHGLLPAPANPLYLLAYLGMGSGAALLFVGEGGMGLMAILESVSHILSFTRLVGILLASVILALVINTVSRGLLAGTVLGSAALAIGLGLLILIVGQTFNVVLGVFEPGIQGARLIFVEHFSKYYGGNGRPFRPLSSRRRHTVAPAPPAVPGR